MTTDLTDQNRTNDDRRETMGCSGSKQAAVEEPQKKPVRKNRRGSLGAFTRDAYKDAQEKGEAENTPPPGAN